MSLMLVRGFEREIPDHKLKILRLQDQRLDRWIGADNDRRACDRCVYSDVVYLMPLEANHRPKVDQRFAAFCRNISKGGCAILRNRLLSREEWSIFFPHLRPLSTEPVCFLARVAHDRPVPLGMYEIGLEFQSVVTLHARDVSRMVDKS